MTGKPTPTKRVPSASAAEATPELDIVADRNDRAFLGHPKGLGYLSFIEACERFSYYSMQTLLTLYMVNYLLVPARMDGVLGLNWLRSWHYEGLSGQPLAVAPSWVDQSALYAAMRARGAMPLTLPNTEAGPVAATPKLPPAVEAVCEPWPL